MFRLVKKHIAGQTMDAALTRTKELNALGLPASITFLSHIPLDKAKVNYITATYMQLARQIARLGLKASLHIPLEQLGRGISEDVTAKSLENILDTTNKYGIFTWCEIKEPLKDLRIIKGLDGKKGIGIVLKSLDNASLYSVYIKKWHAPNAIKSACSISGDNAKPEKGAVAKKLDDIMKTSRNVVLSSPSEKLVSSLLKDQKYKKSLIFEFQLGYSEKHINKLLKRGAKLSMYVPFGRDWVEYAMKNVPERYTRVLANNLLNGEE